MALEGMKLFERHGATHTRLLWATTAGELSSSYVLSNEFANAEDYGSFIDALYRDGEYEALMARIDAPDSPVTIESRSLTADVPLDRQGPTPHGGVIEVYLSRLVPGRFEACRRLAADLFDFLEAHGASNCRLGQLSHAGVSTRALVASWEFQTMKERGAATDAVGTNPAGQRIMELITGSDSPVVPSWSGLYRDVHL
jgi:hypothetical protein